MEQLNSSIMANVSGNDSDSPSVYEQLYSLSTPEIVMWFAMYGCISFLAVTGNCLVTFIILTRKRFQTVTNYFILNLAIADALTGLLAIPFKFQAALLQKWLLPHFMCQVVPFIETVTLSVSVFTLTGTSIDRFRAMIFPHSQKMKKCLAKIIICFIWLISIVFSVPYGASHVVLNYYPFISNVTFDHDKCFPIKPMATWWRVYNIYLTIIQYFVPLIIIDSAYCFIAYKVWLTKPPENMDSRARAFEQSKRRVLKMLVIVVAVFTFCWLPYETYLVLAEVSGINKYFYINVIFFVIHWLAMSNSCLNPIIYGIYNEKFQKEYRVVFRRCCGRFDHSPSHINKSSTMDLDDTKFNGSNMDEQEDRNGGLQNNVCHTYIASELGRDFD